MITISVPGQHRPLISPNKLNRSLSTAAGHHSAAGTPGTPAAGAAGLGLRGPQLLKENMNSSLSRSSREKPGGPPTNSLLFTPNRSISTPGNVYITVRGVIIVNLYLHYTHWLI